MRCCGWSGALLCLEVYEMTGDDGRDEDGVLKTTRE